MTIKGNYRRAPNFHGTNLRGSGSVNILRNKFCDPWIVRARKHPRGKIWKHKFCCQSQVRQIMLRWNLALCGIIKLLTLQTWSSDYQWRCKGEMRPLCWAVQEAWSGILWDPLTLLLFYNMVFCKKKKRQKKTNFVLLFSLFLTSYSPCPGCHGGHEEAWKGTEVSCIWVSFSLHYHCAFGCSLLVYFLLVHKSRVFGSGQQTLVKTLD